MGQEDTCKETNVEDGLVKFSSLVEEQNGKVSLQGGFVDFDVNGGNGIREGVDNVEKNVKSEEVKDDLGVKTSDEIVDVKSGEMLILECGGDRSCEIVGGEGDESSSPSLLASSSEEEEEEDVDDDNDGEMKEMTWEVLDVDLDRMIEDLIIQELFDWSDEDEMFALAGLSMFGNGVKVPPPFPHVAVTLKPCHETLPVGVVSLVVGARVIVEGVEKHDTLNEGSILWITEKRSPLGIVHEIFGPVKNPYYINCLMKQSFQTMEKRRSTRGCKKCLKEGQKLKLLKIGKILKIRLKEKRINIYQPQPNTRVGQVPSNESQYFPPSLLDPGNRSYSLHPVQAFPGGPGFVPMFPQVIASLIQPLEAICSSNSNVPNLVAPSGVWMNRFPFPPPQSMGFPSASTPNNILQFQQNLAQQHYQMLSFNAMPFQQQFNTGQMMPSNFVLSGGQPSFGTGATYTPMNPMMTGQYNFGQFHADMSQYNLSQSQAATNMQGQNAINFNQTQAPVEMQGQHVPAFISTGQQGVLLTGCQSEQNSNSHPLSTGDSQDFSNSVGGGLARNSHRKGGGQCGGGR
ncbi:hypothetical protein POM88_004979 [Heracleum sosnowskyi]|uniref:H/ACA ribonucleoprotein complex non-core subunit NAF1 n=1 Tax=Heracleum sosnowskyi TaxID=360622 RepID=A0AAD8JKZ2_9APIA|nr:hypothetical protein POM88_004979 [Heracleum sosnowskyi]